MSNNIINLKKNVFARHFTTTTRLMMLTYDCSSLGGFTAAVTPQQPFEPGHSFK